MNYHINDKTKVLGAGAFGKVFMTTNKHDSNFKVAIKVLDKNKLGFNLDLIMDEVNTLNKLDHPNIVKYFKTYNDVKYIYLVMEYIKGCLYLIKSLIKQIKHSEKNKLVGTYSIFFTNVNTIFSYIK